jgi:ABC-type amino acid transport substrate-binding protein
MRLSVSLFPFHSIWELPARDVVDVAASGISLTPDRLRSKTLWSLPYSAVRRSALVRADDSHKEYDMHYENFQKFSVVAQSVAHRHAEKHLPKNSRLQFTPSLQQGIQSLLKGETDALGTGSISATHQASRNRRLKVIDLHRQEDHPELISFAVRREKSLLDSLNEFIQQKKMNNFIDDHIYRY